MATYRPGPLVAAVSGTIGGVNFTTSQRRPVLRRAQRHASNASPQQLSNRATFQRLAHAWLTLTNAQRNAWSTLASQLRWTDALDQPRQPTGREFFITHNLELARAGQTLDTTTPPVAYDARFIFTPGLTISAAETANLQFNSGTGPLFFGLSIYVQTFHRPTPQYVPSFTAQPIGRLPNRWKFCKWINAQSGATVNLYPQALPLVGPMAVGQVLAVRTKFVQSASFATASWQTTAKR